MAKFTEDTLSNWTNPPSDTEEEKLSNAERMVKEAIRSDEKLKSKGINIFGQGSYANNTNIRLDSDIDINVNYTDAFYYDLPNGLTKEELGFGNDIAYSFSEYKGDIENALVSKFGRLNIKRKNKCLTAIENTYRAEIDVVPTWQHRWYRKDKTYADGVVLFADNDFSSKVVNYPLQHIDNGKNKNTDTLRRYKSLVRIFKKAKVKMEDDKYYTDNNISSFLLECLVWNCPNSIFTNYDSWNDRIQKAIYYIWDKTQQDESCKEWGEVSELLYLFISRKWTVKAVNDYMVKMWNYMGYNN